MSSKRTRTPSDDPSDSSHDSLQTKVEKAATKLQRRSSPKSSPNRKIPHRGNPLTCTLPPTCAHPNPPTALANSKELEQHHSIYHTHVCTAPENDNSGGHHPETGIASLGQRRSRPRDCGKVFPDARLLDLHLSECHDPLVAIRQERGEKTFRCFVSTCEGKFLGPKQRRLHLIDAHQYPKEYFFAVTNKGIGGMLGKWGEGASMLRKQWKPRPDQAHSKKELGSDEEDAASKASHEENDGADSMEVDDSKLAAKTPPSLPDMPDIEALDPSKRQSSRDIPPHMAISQGAAKVPKAPSKAPPKLPSTAPLESPVDALASSMDALSLVPASVRFGRGGRNGGFVGSGRSPKHSKGFVRDASLQPLGGLQERRADHRPVGGLTSARAVETPTGNVN